MGYISWTVNSFFVINVLSWWEYRSKEFVPVHTNGSTEGKSSLQRTAKTDRSFFLVFCFCNAFVCFCNEFVCFRFCLCNVFVCFRYCNAFVCFRLNCVLLQLGNIRFHFRDFVSGFFIDLRFFCRRRRWIHSSRVGKCFYIYIQLYTLVWNCKKLRFQTTFNNAKSINVFCVG